MVKDVIYHGNKTGRPGSVARKGVLTMKDEKSAMQKTTEALTGLFVIAIVGLWLAAAVLGPLAIIKYCWGYLF